MQTCHCEALFAFFIATFPWFVSTLRWIGPGRILRHFRVVQDTIMSLIDNHKKSRKDKNQVGFCAQYQSYVYMQVLIMCVFSCLF